MRGVLGLLGVVIVLAVGLTIYRSYFTGSGSPSGSVTMGTNNPRAAADISGVKNDLSVLAQAERAYFALNGKYATLEELQSEGHVAINAQGRLNYSYSIEISGNHFAITAKYRGPATGMPDFSIDETMQVTQQ